MSQIENIFNEWCNLRLQVGYKRTPTFTAARRKIIISALCEYDECDLIVMIRYIRFSVDDYAKFLRGEGRRRSYTDCTNLFRKRKLKDKIQKAKEWSDRTESTPIDDVYLPFVIEEGP